MNLVALHVKLTHHSANSYGKRSNNNLIKIVKSIPNHREKTWKDANCSVGMEGRSL
jgi:hypothetical protein